MTTERGVRLSVILLFACIAAFIFFSPFIFPLIGEKGNNFHFIVRIGEFFILCFLVKCKGVLPSVCIPEKFIYIGEWKRKCGEYFDELKEMGKIPCTLYQNHAIFQKWLFMLALAGLIVILVLGRNYKTNPKQ